MSKKERHKKKKRQQPRPQIKKSLKKIQQPRKGSNSYITRIRNISKKILETFKDIERVKSIISENISIIEEYFRKYDSIQLLGSIGLYLLDNLPNFEKHFMAQFTHHKLDLDENAEAIAEYAINFGLALPNDHKESPTEDVVEDLRNRLKALFVAYTFLNMPLGNDAEQSIDWMIHMNTIVVRGDGYQTHVYEVFKEMFTPHTQFYINKYGFSIQQLFDFFMELEDRIVCKIGDQSTIYGAAKLYERWKKWEKSNFGPLDSEDFFNDRDFSKGLFGDFFEANPDILHSEDGNHFLLCQHDDFSQSDKVFWVYPQNDIETKIMDTLSMSFGDNSAFLAEGEFKGSIMNGGSIFQKPFIKDGDKFYCFTPMIPHRNLFMIAENLMKRDNAYYQRNFQQNTNSNSRDAYIERKVKSVMVSFLPYVNFYASVHYKVIEYGVEKNPELDILGISDKATYIIEVKAHELSYKDRVRLDGAKEKFKASVCEACRQCCRAMDSIINQNNPIFGTHSGMVHIDKTKPIYRIAVTFQHYSSLLGQMDELVNAGMLDSRYRETWVVSLFDLMVVADFIESEDEFMSYLDMRKIINTNHSTFFDELDILAQFLNHNLKDKISPDQPAIIEGGSEEIDEEYAKDFYPEIKDSSTDN